MTFDEVMNFTRTVGSHASFEDEECRAYFELADALPPGSSILEIGVQFGRSTSIVAQVAKEKGHRLVCIDPFIEPPEAGPSFMKMMLKIGHPFILHCCKTEEVERAEFEYMQSIKLVLIDGNHNAEYVRKDIEFVMNYMALDGGVVCFHDFGRDSLPDVYPTAMELMPNYGWEHEKTVGTLGIFRPE